MFLPIYKKLNKKIKNSTLTSVIISLLIIILILIPALFVTTNAVRESENLNELYQGTKEKLLDSEQLNCEENAVFCGIVNQVNQLLSNPQTKVYFENALFKITTFIVESASSFILLFPLFILNIFVVVVAMFYLFKDGHHILESIKKHIPIKRSYQDQIIKSFKEMFHALIYGHFLIAIMEGFIAAIGFSLINLNSPILWGIVVAILALIPIIGAPIIWLPVMIYKFVSNQPFHAFAILFIGILLSFIDNFVKPKIIGDKSKIHPLLILLGVLGGIKFFGFLGFLLGPIIISIFITTLNIYERRHNET